MPQVTVHQLVVLPTKDTLDYLNKVFSACPFDHDFRTIYVEINSSLTEMEPEPDNVYTARAGTMRPFYDTATQTTSLILPLFSQSLTERCAQVREYAPSAFYGHLYFPNMVVKPNMPPLAKSYRSFIASVANTLATAEDAVLIFDAELVVTKTYMAAPQLDFYAAMESNVYR